MLYSRARHGGDARASRAASRWCCRPRRRRSNRGSMPMPAATAGSCCAERYRRRRCRSSPRSTSAWTSPSAAASWRRRWSTAIGETLAERRAGAPVPQPPRLRAADAVPRRAATASSAPTARPGWSSIAFAACSLCHHCGHFEPKPRVCPRCGDVEQPDAGRPRGSSGWPRKSPSASRRRARSSCPATSPAASSACAASSRRSPRARPTS